MIFGTTADQAASKLHKLEGRLVDAKNEVERLAAEHRSIAYDSMEIEATGDKRLEEIKKRLARARANVSDIESAVIEATQRYRRVVREEEAAQNRVAWVNVQAIAEKRVAIAAKTEKTIEALAQQVNALHELGVQLYEAAPLRLGRIPDYLLPSTVDIGVKIALAKVGVRWAHPDTQDQIEKLPRLSETINDGNVILLRQREDI